MTFDELLKAYPLLKALQDKLLQVGGTRVELHHDEEDGIADYTMNVVALPAILHEGHLLDLPVRQETVAHNQCHNNAATLFLQGKLDAIGTGFALQDQIWYHHSWGINTDNAGTAIIETTGEDFKPYYGITRTGAAGEQLAQQLAFLSNAWPADRT